MAIDPGPGPRLSLVVPCHNEEENVKPLVASCFEALEAAGISFEMVCVDDGSEDGTLRKLLEARRGRPALRVLRLRERTGQSGALLAGFRAARGELVATADGDLQNDPAELPALLKVLEEGPWDMVSGWRQARKDSWVRRVSTRVANAVRKRCLRDGMNDSASSMKVFRRAVLDGMPAFDGMHRFFPALARLQGYRVTEVPVRHHPRLHGRAKYGVWNRVFRATIDMFGVAWLARRALKLEVEEMEV